MEPHPTHSMKRRSPGNNYNSPGIYHITLTLHNRKLQSLGTVTGDLQYPDGHPAAPKTELSAVGRMVEHELLHSITSHYPAIEIRDYVIMPEHIHFIAVVKYSLVSKSGRMVHLGQVLAGFKSGCNRRYWSITGQATTAAPSASPASSLSGSEVAAKPLLTPAPHPAQSVAGGFAASAPVPGAKKLRFSSGRQPLFSDGYTDVIPLKEGQLETQRAYIRANPRNRLLRMNNPTNLRPQRNVVNTLVTPSALRGYLLRERAIQDTDQQTWATLTSRLHFDNNYIICDGYGDSQLLHRPLLPVVCHRKDLRHFSLQKQRCLDAAAKGSILVSARIARGEQDIMDEAIQRGFPVILVSDNGFPEIYHPSESRLNLCASSHLLLLTPWKYHYRRSDEEITVAECKTMNCIVQALCRTKDDWWK